MIARPVRTVATMGGTMRDASVLGTDAGGNLVTRRVRVVVAKGPDQGRELMLEAGTLVVGSGPSADLQLNDRRVSRAHVELALVDTGVRVRDLGSRNGTFVGETRVEAVVVPIGTSVRAGETRIDLERADAPVLESIEQTHFGDLVAESRAMRRVLGVLERVAATDVPVVLEGETGVGKTTAAEAIHHASARKHAPLVTIDLAGQPDDTAIASSFAHAAGGTVIVDNLDHGSARSAAAIAAQLGARDSGALDVRTLATSRADVRALVHDGAVRRDVYFGLAGVHLVLPPLRERREDVRAIVHHLAGALGAGGFGRSEDDLAPLRAHPLPGNARQLRRMVEEAIALTPGAKAPAHAAGEPYKAQKERLLHAFEREYVRDLLERHEGNLSRAAAEAGLGRNHLLEMARKHGLR